MPTTRDSGIVEDFVPPPGPPPPIMPNGWIARFDERYQCFYYVNLATKQSQWEKPPGTIDGPVRDETGRPPSYADTKTSSRPTSSYSHHEDSTARPITPSQPQPQHLHTPLPNTSSASHSPNRSLAGRLSSFLKSHSPKPGPTYPQQQQHYYNPQGYYPQHGRPVYISQSGSGYPRRSGMGAGGAAALGVGGGLLGGMMLADAFDDHDGYEQGFEDGADFGGGFDGGDMGDFGGGDF